MPDDGLSPGIDSDAMLRDIFRPAAFNKLTERAKTLTLGDTWRLQGWALDGDPATNEDPVLKLLDMDDMKSISRAVEQHLKDRGNRKDWKYVSPTYACSTCSTCAVSVPPDMGH